MGRQRGDSPEGQTRLDVGVGPRCPVCPHLKICPAAHTAFACPPRRAIGKFGGLNTWDLRHPDTEHLMEVIGGPGFDRVRVGACDLPSGPRFVAQIRVRSALRGQLHGTSYCISASSAIGKRKRVLSAGRLRDLVGLAPTVPIDLQLFGQDAILDRLWLERRELLPQLAEAGYGRILAPSFSTWMPRPVTEHLINHKRSLAIAEALSELGALVLSRTAFAFPGDVSRYARWLQANPLIGAVAVDLGTYRARRAWVEQLVFLADFDELTDQRLRYWIHGPSTLQRLVELFGVIDPKRLTITNARAIAPRLSFARPRTNPGHCLSWRPR